MTINQIAHAKHAYRYPLSNPFNKPPKKAIAASIGTALTASKSTRAKSFFLSYPSIREPSKPPLYPKRPKIKAILDLEKMEKSLPSNYPSANEDCYFTSVTEKLLNPKTQFLSQHITILTGKLDAHLIPLDASEELRANLKAARKIVDCVKDLVPFSDNFLQRARIFSKDYYNDDHVKTIEETLEWVRTTTNNLYPRQCVKEILKYKTGNCHELALVGWFQGKNVIRVKIVNGDHVFLIIGSKTQNPSDYKNLGPHAVVCDPWAGANYPASMLEKYLLSYRKSVEINGMFYAKVEDFKPSKQSLAICND